MALSESFGILRNEFTEGGLSRDSHTVDSCQNPSPLITSTTRIADDVLELLIKDTVTLSVFALSRSAGEEKRRDAAGLLVHDVIIRDDRRRANDEKRVRE